MSKGGEVRVTPGQYQLMLEHVVQEAPLEACGLLGGRDSRVQRVIPIRNAAQSEFRFRMDPAEQIQAIFGLEESGLQLMAIYHSHPAGPPGPSTIDLAEAAYPEALQLIWFLDGEQWICRAYRYERHDALEVELTVDSGQQENGGDHE